VVTGEGDGGRVTGVGDACHEGTYFYCTHLAYFED